jgi:hypothetical protein
MNKIILNHKGSSENRYLVGFCIDFREFTSRYFSARSHISNIHWISDRTVEFDNDSQCTSHRVMTAEEIQDGETCWLKMES